MKYLILALISLGGCAHFEREPQPVVLFEACMRQCADHEDCTLECDNYADTHVWQGSYPSIFSGQFLR